MYLNFTLKAINNQTPPAATILNHAALVQEKYNPVKLITNNTNKITWVNKSCFLEKYNPNRNGKINATAAP